MFALQLEARQRRLLHALDQRRATSARGLESVACRRGDVVSVLRLTWALLGIPLVGSVEFNGVYWARIGDVLVQSDTEEGAWRLAFDSPCPTRDQQLRRIVYAVRWHAILFAILYALRVFL